MCNVRVELRDHAAFTQLLSSDTSNVRGVRFEPDFGVRDHHITSVVRLLREQLLYLTLGDEDTGDGGSITDSAVIEIVRNCPQLQKLYLNACTSVTGQAFKEIVMGLPNLTELSLTGHDKQSGSITDKDLQPLIRKTAYLPRLRDLYLVDQNVGEAAYRLTEKRKRLRIQIGDTCKYTGMTFTLGK